MKKQNKGLMAVVALAIVVVAVSATYAFITFVIEGTKTNTITGGSLVVRLNETANGEGDVSISNAFPVSDAVGKQGKSYKFTLENESVKDVSYTISLVPQDIEEGYERLPDSIVNVYLTNGDDTEVIKDVTAISALGNSTLATGVIPANTDLSFNLRLWIDDSATDTDVWTVASGTTTGKQFAAKISVETVQVAEYAVSVVNTRGGLENVNKAVFYNGTATFDVQFDGNYVPYIECKDTSGNIVPATYEDNADTDTVVVANVKDHLTCVINYTQ